MVIVISRYVDNYSNNSLKIDTEFLINLPMQHLGFTDIGSSFSLEHTRFLQGFAGSIMLFSAIPSGSQNCDDSLYLFVTQLFSLNVPGSSRDHVPSMNFQLTTHSSSMHNQSSFSPLQFLDINIPLHCYNCQKQTQHTCFTRVMLWSMYL